MLQSKLTAFTENRMKTGQLPGGSAPRVSSNSFKLHKSNIEPKAKCWNHRLSLESSDRNASTLKTAATAQTAPSTITLGTARPSPQYFPWDSIAIQGMANSMSCTRGESPYDLDIALNYGYAAGSPQLLRFVTEHVELIHDPPYEDWETCLTCGTTSALEIVFRMICNRNDWILTEAYTYPGMVEAAKPLGLHLMGVEMDANGLLPECLDLKLQAWDVGLGAKPRVLYIIPSGQNPTGTTQKAERRREIYDIAEKHDLLVIEDDPYHFLQLEELPKGETANENPEFELETYLHKLPPSYLSLDFSGRVIRLDATSKILAPGLRCGWITGCSQLIGKFFLHTEFSTVSPSGPLQLMLFKLLDESWGHEGFIRWLKDLSQQYLQRRNTLLKACKQHLPARICHWTVPTTGMFLWIQLDLSLCTAASQNQCDEKLPSSIEMENKIYSRALQNGVAISKGSWFAVSKDSKRIICFRLTFAAASECELGQAVERFAKAVRISLGLD